MPAEFIRVRDTRTDQILPSPVPRKHLDYFPHLKEVPSSREGSQSLVTEPVQPAAAAPVQEPETPAAGGKVTTPKQK